MQDDYVGDIGDYGKYGLLRALTAGGAKLAVNWYRVIPEPAVSKQDDGKYIQYLLEPDAYRHYDPALFDALQQIVHRDHDRTLARVKAEALFDGSFFSAQISPDRCAWHQLALAETAQADVVFLDPDNGLETERMAKKASASVKHVRRQELCDYYARGQDVILYQHRPQRMRKDACIQSVLAFQRTQLQADSVFLLEFPRFTNRYYFIFSHAQHNERYHALCSHMASQWSGLCNALPTDV